MYLCNTSHRYAYLGHSLLHGDLGAQTPSILWLYLLYNLQVLCIQPAHGESVEKALPYPKLLGHLARASPLLDAT